MTEEEKKEGKEDVKEDVAIRNAAESALVHANELLDGFDSLYNNPEARRKTTVPSGIILGSALGNLTIATNATNSDERLDHTQKGFTTIVEILLGTMLGYNARMKKGK